MGSRVPRESLLLIIERSIVGIFFATVHHCTKQLKITGNQLRLLSKLRHKCVLFDPTAFNFRSKNTVNTDLLQQC